MTPTTRTWLVCLALGATVLAGGRAGAHHAAAAYQADVVVLLEGTVQATQFSDPHTLLQIAAVDGSYVVEWLAASELAAMGVDEATFRPGTYLVLTGSPSVNPRAKRMSLVSEIFRPEDGWRWRLEDGEPALDAPGPR